MADTAAAAAGAGDDATAAAPQPTSAISPTAWQASKQKVRRLRTLRNRLLADLVQGNKELTQQQQRRATDRPAPPTLDVAAPPQVVILCLCLPDAFANHIAFSAEVVGKAVPIFVNESPSSSRVATKFLREQPWLKRPNFHLLIYAPLDFQLQLVLELKLDKTQAVVLRNVATQAQQAEYKERTKKNGDDSTLKMATAVNLPVRMLGCFVLLGSRVIVGGGGAKNSFVVRIMTATLLLLLLWAAAAADTVA